MQEIKVLGAGCAKCKKLADNVKEAIKSTGREYNFEYVNDMERIIGYGILMTPGLVVDEKVVSTGRVLPVKDILNLIQS